MSTPRHRHRHWPPQRHPPDWEQVNTSTRRKRCHVTPQPFAAKTMAVTAKPVPRTTVWDLLARKARGDEDLSL
ncbi:hypothetical protein PF005_g13692 [Phytophthora fragariae]|uniref:Uncharacterized protein n=1 Tax=Phytophthora fragariae TaxID=53985 RepID=A0A6A3F6T9_9STRA|nr:hypothetical protein PF003_g1499 [Phytophthora fragariae]KAE8941724.1 hypothetical protein PF009_g8491 [Phytophthora fragariae]KAE9111681.1 hypothetical protein PF007_g11392 [Phytophthora fragariae]KAE9144021.1 hypothetical protein PF006_g10999 [Phytophthora fragariae]KAE9204724.1 hypothetical protein PF005_g13692 [Phytophthora fragariae]